MQAGPKGAAASCQSDGKSARGDRGTYGQAQETIDTSPMPKAATRSQMRLVLPVIGYDGASELKGAPRPSKVT
jgi:hypothetical protein